MLLSTSEGTLLSFERRLTAMRKPEFTFATCRPCNTTSRGSRGSASVTRFWVCTAAVSGFVPDSKYSVMLPPLFEDDDEKYIRLSMPVSCCSMTWMTVRSTTSALAPGYVALMETCGGATSGYASAGSPRMAKTPPRVMTMAITHANTGRSMKNCGMLESALRVLLLTSGGGSCAFGSRRWRRRSCGAVRLYRLRLDGHARSDFLQVVDDDLVTIGKPARDHPIAADD